MLYILADYTHYSGEQFTQLPHMEKTGNMTKQGTPLGTFNTRHRNALISGKVEEMTHEEETTSGKPSPTTLV